MKTILTLDYELFLGDNTGTVGQCLIEPLNCFLKVVASSNTKFTIFVDAAYLYMLDSLRDKWSSLEHDFQAICNHLLYLQRLGHEIQLHIHPQWYFSEYDGEKWILDKTHYKLYDVDESQILDYFVESKQTLDGIIGKQTIAFRAGGFSAQPTRLLRKLFNATGIKIDSSVCPGTKYDSDCQKYDYSNVPPKNFYYFSDDICHEEPNGDFIEIPISMIKVSPIFHWKLALTKLAVKLGGGEEFERMGDGLSVKSTGSSIFTRMTQTVQTMATIDEYKASLLNQAYKKVRDDGGKYFCVLGHPKLATSYSIRKLGEFCSYVKMNGGEFVTISEIV